MRVIVGGTVPDDLADETRGGSFVTNPPNQFLGGVGATADADGGTVSLVRHPALQTQPSGLTKDERSEPNALNAASERQEPTTVRATRQCHRPTAAHPRFSTTVARPATTAPPVASEAPRLTAGRPLPRPLTARTGQRARAELPAQPSRRDTRRDRDLRIGAARPTRGGRGARRVPAVVRGAHRRHLRRPLQPLFRRTPASGPDYLK